MSAHYTFELDDNPAASALQARLFARPALASALVGALYLALAFLSLYVSRQAGSTATIWYANALAVACLVHAPSLQRSIMLWLATAFACFAAKFAWDGDAALALYFMLPNLLEIGLGVWLLRRADLAHANLRSPWALLRLLALGGVVPQLLSAAASAWLFQGQRGPLFQDTWLGWFEGSVIGALSMLALACLCLRLSPQALRSAWLDWRFLALLPLSLAVTVWAMGSSAFAFIYVSVPLLLAAMLLDLVAVCLLTLVVSVTVAMALAQGLFIPPPVQFVWENGLVYLAFAAALLPAQLLSASVTAMRDGRERLTARTRELEAANERLQQFVHIASHDLREPLNTITQFGGLLQADLKDSLPAQESEYLRLMSQATQRMRHLLDDVLVYARLPGESAAPAADVDLSRVLDEVRDGLAGAVRVSQGRIEIEPLPTVRGHASLLSLLFQNLLGNGLKFVPLGRAPLVRVRVQRVPGWQVISVQDNGIGIAPEDQGRLFKPFSRLHPRRTYEGTGLGLTLCLQVAQAHGGRIEIESALESGSCFHVWLPDAPPGDVPGRSA